MTTTTTALDLPETAEVLVIGAGPTGLALTGALRASGVDVCVIDASDGPCAESRALMLHARTLEQLHPYGITPETFGHGRPLSEADLWDGEERLGSVRLGGDDALGTRYPSGLALAQHHTEVTLEAWAARLGAPVHRAHRLVGLTQDGDAVRAEIERPDGARSVVRARFAVGCDGARSATRRLLDVPFVGDSDPTWWGLLDVTIDWARDPHRGHVFVTPDRMVIAIPFGPLGHYRLISALSTDDVAADPDARPTLSAANFEAWLSACGVTDARLVEPGWCSAFRVAHRRAERYRVGRVFVAGDAAHIHSPLGGRGMNTGIQDALNLAWKLALVCSGGAAEGLLDTYHAERAPIASALLDTTRRMTRAALSDGPVSGRLRALAMRAVAHLDGLQARAMPATTMLDIAYPDSPLVGEALPAVWELPLWASPDSETPPVSEHAALRQGPRPGERLPDGEIEAGRRAHDLIDPLRHTLLLLDGPNATAEGDRNLSAIAAQARAAFGDRVRVWVITPGDRPRPDALSDAVAWTSDPDGQLHALAGAPGECALVVRPDGIVSFRGLPARWEPLSATLRKTLNATL